jgi:hypothetical protein
MENIKANSLDSMFDQQHDLLKYYTELEGLPDFPVNIHSKTGRKLLKDFVARFVEELSEAYEALNDELDFITTNNRSEAIKSLRKYNLEIADANHFLLEFLIFAGYGSWQRVEDLVDLFVRKYEQFQGLVVDERPIKSLLAIGGAINYKQAMRGTSKPRPDLFTVADSQMAMEDRTLYGGRYIAEPAIEIHQQLLWRATCNFFLVLNTLKSKEWTAEQISDKINFEENLAMSLVHYFVYLDFAGHSEISLATCFYLETQKNLKRIREGY